MKQEVRPAQENAEAPLRIAVVVNPRSAGGKTERNWGHIAAALRTHLGPFDVRFTKSAGDGANQAYEAALSGHTLVLAMGGDGTLGEVVDGLMRLPEPVRKTVEVGLLPAGTGGDFRRTLEAPKRLADASLALRGGRPWPLDVGKVHYQDHDGNRATRHFVNVAGFGIAGVVDDCVNRSHKRLPGKLSFLVATMQAQRIYRNQSVRMRVDGGEWKTSIIHNVAVANGRYFGGGMMIAPQARLDDGKLDVVALGDFTRSELLLHGLRIYTGAHLTLDKVSHVQAQKLEAEPATPNGRILLDVDGENVGTLPATFEILPAALRIRLGSQAS